MLLDDEFECPNCQALYKMMRVSLGPQIIDRLVHCTVCLRRQGFLRAGLRRAASRSDSACSSSLLCRFMLPFADFAEIRC
jgi:predicted Zn finger-like uncharacterized protein